MEDQASIRRDLDLLGKKIATLRSSRSRAVRERVPDADLFHKGAVWALRYETTLAPRDRDLVRRALARGLERAEALAAGRVLWASKKGSLVRGYASRVDGSTQPYGLVVPAGYDPEKPLRLDVVLHGSTRPVGLSELRFVNPLDDGDSGGKPAPAVDYLELRPLGRVENCYRWAGETDVFEAIEDVCRGYNVDRDRIVLRGMSMGASGTWHLGLKHPGFFAALGPYCGYVDTHQFSLSPMPNFVPVGTLPPNQEKTLHMLDSVDYAANAEMVPAVAAMGDRDPFFQAHVLMGQRMRAEGLRMVNLIAPGTGHVQDPATHAAQMRRLGEYAARGRERLPRRLRFVTWTLKYPRSHWIELLGLEEHYRRAEVRARLPRDGAVEIDAVENVTRFAVLPPALEGPARRLRVLGQDVPLPALGKGEPPAALVIGRRSGRWACLGRRSEVRLDGKRPGLQGPIDDAFTEPFLCVRGTGTPWNPKVGAWADAALKRFAYEWNRYFRGDLPVKDDTAVTAEDLRGRNLVLFGDGGSNRWIARALPKLPVRWSAREVAVGLERYPAADHAPALVCPNPLPGGEGRYLVLNSGHTFHEKELASLNYLLFPRLGDWAVLRVPDRVPAAPAELPVEEAVKTGFFDERWRL